MSQAGYSVARLTVRLDAIRENYRRCREFAGPAEVAAVVKADGYGLGAHEAARTLQAAGCATFFVARLEEAVALRPVAPRARIFVLDGAQAETVSALIDHGLVPVLNTEQDVAVWAAASRARGVALDAAVHVDTGLNRLGLPDRELAALGPRLNALRVALVMSHLACGDDPQSPMNEHQHSRFRAALGLLPPAPASLAASGGLVLGKAYAFDLVRPGIALYGGNPRSAQPNPFSVAARLCGRILQLRRVDKPDSVGYGATFRVERPMVLATVGLGYADGLKRALGNRGAGAIAGQRVPIVGRVSMDLVTLDVTAVAEPLRAEGADVEFLGDTIALEDVAAAAGTAHYEILTSLGRRFPRVYTDETIT